MTPYWDKKIGAPLESGIKLIKESLSYQAVFVYADTTWYDFKYTYLLPWLKKTMDVPLKGYNSWKI